MDLFGVVPGTHCSIAHRFPLGPWTYQNSEQKPSGCVGHGQAHAQSHCMFVCVFVCVCVCVCV